MNKYLYSVLFRLKKGFSLLHTLMQEEFSALKEHDPKKIAAVELSVQDLLQQLMREKQLLSKNIRESGFFSLELWLREHQGQKEIKRLWDEAREEEQKAATQASKNNSLARALAEQSAALLGFFYEQVCVEQGDMYSSQARFSRRRREAGLVRGRL
ncbi:MAG: flagellar export chaperone FlgN [Desulfonatronovibrionaceae bacterium]